MNSPTDRGERGTPPSQHPLHSKPVYKTGVYVQPGACQDTSVSRRNKELENRMNKEHTGEGPSALCRHRGRLYI